MKPLKFSEVITETAERTGQPTLIAEILLRMYFKDLRSSLTSLAHPRVQVMNLGSFNLKPLTLEKRMHRRQALLAKLITSSLRGRMIKQEVSQEVEQMGRVLEMVRDEQERKSSLRVCRASDERLDLDQDVKVRG